MSTKATIYDVARQAEVSPRTVSRFFNAPDLLAEKTAARIRDVVETLRFRPSVYANRMSDRLAETFGILVYQERSYLLDEHRQLLLSHISAEMCARGKDLLLIGANKQNEKRIIKESLHRVKFNTLLLLRRPSAKLEHELQQSSLRTLSINWEPSEPVPNHVYVGIDYYRSSYDYTAALLDKGYRRICYVGPPNPATEMSARSEAVENAIHDFGNGAEVTHVNCIHWEDRFAEGAAAFQQISELSQRPDLVYCCDDYSAIGLLSAARRAGLRIPNDMAVVGFDGNKQSMWCVPSLTTVEQPWKEMAQVAVEILCDDTRRESAAARTVLDTKIRWGESCR